MSNIVLVADPTSWPELEHRADALRSEIFPDLDSDYAPVPIEEVIEFELRRFDCDLAVVDYLATGVEACVDWDVTTGRFRMTLPEEVYQDMYEGDGRARFTAAHEFAHLVLHGDKIRKAAGATVPSGLFRRSRDVPPFINAERQANVFAGSFLLPREKVASAIQTHGLNLGTLAETLQVSLRAMDVRMRELRGRL